MAFRDVRNASTVNTSDALHPDKFRSIVREAIERYILAGYIDALNEAEESERTILERMAEAAAG